VTAVEDLAVPDAGLGSLPADPDTERALLGACLESPAAVADAVEAGVTAADFYSPGHAAVWESVCRVPAPGVVEVRADMDAHGTLRALPNPAYLVTLGRYAVAASAGFYARRVMGFAARRRAITAGQRIMQAGWRLSDPSEVQAEAEDAVARISAPVDTSTWSPLGEIAGDVWAEYQATKNRGYVEGIRWGYIDIDRVMNPLQPGDLAVVVAWAGGGKSVVASNLALDASIVQGKRSLVHALEMTRRQLGQRWAAKTGGLCLSKILDGTLSEDEECRFWEALAEMEAAPLIVDEVGSLSLSRLRASIRRHKPEIVIVDQIPIMEVDDPAGRASREQALTRLSYGLKELAKAEGLPIVACAQLNSAPLNRAEKLPTLEDIRESRGIGQAATIAVFLWDPCKVQPESPRAGEIDWIIRKQRQGRSDLIIPMAQQFHYSRLYDLGRDPEGA